MNLATKEGVLEFVEGIKRDALRNFAEDGHLDMVFFVLCSKDPITGEQFKEPKTCIIAAPGPQNKNRVSHFVRETVVRTDAVGVVTVAEAWFAEMPEGTKRSDLPDDLSKYPESKEMLFITLEHREIPSTCWFALITRNSGGQATVSEFVKRESSYSHGRFTQFLNGFESDPTLS